MHGLCLLLGVVHSQQGLISLTNVLCSCSKLADAARKKAKRKKKSWRTSLSGDGNTGANTATSALDDIDTDLPVTPKSGLDSDSDADLAPDHPADQASESHADEHSSAHMKSEQAGEDSSELTTAPGSSSRGMPTANHSRTSSATAELESHSSVADFGMDSAGQEAVKAALEAAVTQANSAIEVGVAAGDDVLQRVLDELDTAIHNAVEGSISAKYSKKVRKRLQQLLHEAVTAAASGDEEAVAAAAAVAVADKQEWHTAGAKLHRPSHSWADPVVASTEHTGKQHGAGGGHSPQRVHHRQGQVLSQGQAQPGLALSHLLQLPGVVGPPPPPPPRQPPPPPPRQPPPPPPSQAAAQLQARAAEQVSGSSLQSPAGPGHTMAKSGNAWGVPAKQRSNAQVSPSQTTAYMPVAYTGQGKLVSMFVTNCRLRDSQPA